jgi:hypothetical protein
VYEESRLFPRKPLQKLARLDLVAFKALEFSHHPCHEGLIEIPEQGVQRRWSIVPVVLDLAPEERIEPLSNVLQGQLCLMAKIQLPNRRPHGVHCRGANRGIESAK